MKWRVVSVNGFDFVLAAVLFLPLTIWALVVMVAVLGNEMWRDFKRDFFGSDSIWNADDSSDQ